MKENKLSQKELEKALSVLGCPPTRREILKIFESLDPSFTDYISIDLLIEAMYPNSSSGSARTSARSERNGHDAIAIFKRRPDLVEDIMSRLTNKSHINNLLIEFEKNDKHKSGSLERGEFVRCLKQSNIELSTAISRDLVDTLGDGASSIDYNDFIDACRTELQKDIVTDDIILQLQKKISRDMKHGISINDEFRLLDKNDDGELDIDEIEQGFEKIGIPLNRDETKRIVQKFSIRGNTIKYKSFLAALSPDTLNDGDIVKLLIDRIKFKIEERVGSASNAIREIKETFADIDLDNSGSIDETELRNAMRKLHVDLDRNDLSIIFKRYASDIKDKRGEMDYDDFLRMLDIAGTKQNTLPSSSSASARDRDRDRPSSRSVKKVVDDIRAKIEDYLGDGAGVASRIKDIFAEIDRNRDGTVDQHEFTYALKLLRADCSIDDVDLIFAYYDADKNGVLDYDEFIRLLGFETASNRYTRNDRDREERKRN